MAVFKHLTLFPLLALVMSASLILSHVGCADQQESNASPTAVETPATETPADSEPPETDEQTSETEASSVESQQAEVVDSAISSDDTPESWTSFRNSPQQLGVAHTTLPDNLELLWEYEAPDGLL